MLADRMKQEVHLTIHGDGPGKPAWRDHVASNINVSGTASTASALSVDVGYVPTNTPEEVRAMIVAYGAGKNAEGGGDPIHAGPYGRDVWDGDVSGKHPSTAVSEYDLPDGFNQVGNQFITNALRLVQNEFGERVAEAIPKEVVYRKVQVRAT